MNKLRFGKLCLFCMCSAILHSNVFAASLRISPTTIEFQAEQNSQTLSILNQSSEVTTVQARIFKWTQEQGRDVLTPSNDIVVSPPVISLNSATSYNYRVVNLDKTPVKDERSYRLILDELPKPIDPRKPPQGLSVLMRISLPVFITNKDEMQQIAWKIETKSEKTVLTVINQGGRRALLDNVKVIDLTDNKEYEMPISTVNGYVLVGKERSYAFAPNFTFNPAHNYALNLNLNGKKVQL